MQMLLVAMLIDAAHPAFEYREISFDGVGMDITAHVFANAVNNKVMICKVAFNLPY